MKPRLILSIMAVFWVIAGLIGIFAPAQYMSAFGLGAPNEAVIAVRDGGVVVIGLGIIDWLARDAVGSPLRGILWGNIFILVADAALNIFEIAAGIAPFGPWVVSFALQVLLVPLLAWGLVQARRASP